ncbi:MAG: hypothetical protein WCA31_10035, partial [Acidimicrobiales bacterium]
MFQRILLLWLLGTVSALAQTGAVQGHSFVGGTPSVTSGLKSANYLDGIIPHATITVYFTGTTNLVPGSQIFSNSTGTVLGNPFTSNDISSLNPGGWLFFAAQGQGYDVVGSGGLSPNTYGAPTPLCTDCFASGGGGGGGGCSTGGIPTTNGSVTGDNSSTNCGYENRVGDTAAVPANVQTFGSNLLANNSSTYVVAAGENIGSYLSGTTNVLLGSNEAQGTLSQPCALSDGSVLIGDSNSQNCPGSVGTGALIGIGNGNLAFPSSNTLFTTNVVALGTDNLIALESTTGNLRWIFAGGYNNMNTLKASSQELVAIGESNIQGVSGGSAVSDILGLGDSNCNSIPDGSSDVVCLGDGSGDSSATSPITSAVLIGVDALTDGSGTDIVLIGDQPATGFSGTASSGNDLVGVGNHVLACNTTGSDNVG